MDKIYNLAKLTAYTHGHFYAYILFNHYIAYIKCLTTDKIFKNENVI